MKEPPNHAVTEQHKQKAYGEEKNKKINTLVVFELIIAAFVIILFIDLGLEIKGEEMTMYQKICLNFMIMIFLKVIQE